MIENGSLWCAHQRHLFEVRVGGEITISSSMPCISVSLGNYVGQNDAKLLEWDIFSFYTKRLRRMLGHTSLTCQIAKVIWAVMLHLWTFLKLRKPFCIFLLQRVVNEDARCISLVKLLKPSRLLCLWATLIGNFVTLSMGFWPSRQPHSALPPLSYNLMFDYPR